MGRSEERRVGKEWVRTGRREGGGEEEKKKKREGGKRGGGKEEGEKKGGERGREGRSAVEMLFGSLLLGSFEQS